MDQQLINWFFTLVGTLIGWILKIIWDAISELKTDMKTLNKEIHEEFLRKDDYREDISDIKVMLNRIFEKLDTKVDK